MMAALVLASNPLTANLERNLAAALASTFPRITNKFPEIMYSKFHRLSQRSQVVIQ